jgi:hypothetical protein
MSSALLRAVSRLLIVTMLLLPFQSVNAGMIATDQAMPSGAQVERASLLGALDRPDVAAQMQALGLNAATAKERVAAMTDEEVRTLAGKMDSLPAGAKTSGWAVVFVILVGVAIYYAFYAKR